ncbi:hypothetical protein BDAP_001902 [Binucleata daphniae]
MFDKEKQSVKHAGAILQMKDKYVLVKSKTKNHFVFPKGKIKANEKPFEAAKREALEEAGAIVIGKGTHRIVDDITWYDCEVIELISEYNEKDIRERTIVDCANIMDINISKKTQNLLHQYDKTV